MASEHKPSCDPVNRYLSVYQFFEKRGWPTMLLVLGIVFVWLKVVPIIDRIADSHIEFVQEVSETNKQVAETLIIIKEQNREWREEFRRTLDRLSPSDGIGEAHDAK